MMISGYEGDASDAEDDTAASAVSASNGSITRFTVLQMALLDFWLILRQDMDKVHVFFQTRFIDLCNCCESVHYICYGNCVSPLVSK